MSRTIAVHLRYKSLYISLPSSAKQQREMTNRQQDGVLHAHALLVWAKCSRRLSELITGHSRSQRPRSFWSAPRIATSGRVQQRKSAIHGLPVTLRMLRVKSDKSDWFWFQSIVFTNPFKTGMSLD